MVDYLQFAFRWMNNLLMREFPLKCVIRLWDSYLVRGRERERGERVREETEREREDVFDMIDREGGRGRVCDIIPYSSLSLMDSPHCMFTCVPLCCHSILRKSRNKEIFR